MSEWRATAASRAELHSALRAQIEQLAPGARLVASDVLAAESSIDLVLAGSDGQAIAVDVSEPGHELEALVRAAAHASWLAARLRDWRKLAPELPIRPELPVRALLLVQELGEELRAAAGALPALELLQYRALATPDGLRVLLLREPPAGRAGSPAAAALPKLRSSLTDAQLGLTPEESAAFED